MKFAIHILLFSIYFQIFPSDLGKIVVDVSKKTCCSTQVEEDSHCEMHPQNSQSSDCTHKKEKSSDQIKDHKCVDDCSCNCCANHHIGNSFFIAPSLGHGFTISPSLKVNFHIKSLNLSDINYSTFHPPRNIQSA